MKLQQTKGLSLKQALEHKVPIRRFSEFKKFSCLLDSDYILKNYNDNISNYKLSKEELMAQDWELSEEAFRQFFVKKHSQGFYHIDKEVGYVNRDEDIKTIEKKLGDSILSRHDLVKALETFQLPSLTSNQLDSLFKTHYSLMEALSSGKDFKLDSSVDKFSTNKSKTFIKADEDFSKVKFTESEIRSNAWVLKEKNTREFIVTCEDEGYHKSEKHTFIKEGKEQITEDEIHLIEVPLGFKVFNYKDLDSKIPELKSLSEKNRFLFGKFLGFIPWEIDLLKKVL